MPRIQLLVIQPTPFCNIDCRYCYLPQRNSKAVVAEQTLANLFSQVFASGWAEDGLTVIWHAGEPMVLPIDFYRRAFRLIDGLKPEGLSLTHSFQTNGTLIDDAWCDFFAAEQISVGVSIDGPQRLHDINRRTRSGHGTFERTIAGIRRLLLITAQTAEDPKGFQWNPQGIEITVLLALVLGITVALILLRRFYGRTQTAME